jgi:asparagine synthase (glutamine-hydrolysing)
MAATLVHRGPDDQGLFASPSVALAFRRLSILDLSPAGHQPFLSDDGQLVLVFNGELFNFVELREDLRARGHHFHSTGDTEVLLHAYLEWGTDCVSRFNGMWAFLLYDARRQVVFGSRDRFGIKPLYRRTLNDRICFASEIKALVAAPGAPVEPDWETARRFLTAGRLDSLPDQRRTFFAGIEQVSPGCAFEIAMDGTERTWQFWSVPEEEPNGIEGPVPVFRDLLQDAVRLRLRSDVPVGVSLSGGLDSTSIISLMASLRAAHQDEGALPALHAFSYMPPEYDETRYVMATVDATGALLHRTDLGPEALWDRLPTLLRYQDEPVHSATAQIGFEIYRLAAEHGTKVILCGQGADETIGGYHPYFADAWYTHLHRGQLRTAVRNIVAYCRAYGVPVGPTIAKAARRLVLAEANRLGSYRSVMRGRRAKRASYMAGWFTWDAPVTEAANPHIDVTPPLLNEVLSRAVKEVPLPLYLRIEDRNSMAHSVEARLPFLDYRLVSLAFRLAPEWKLRGPWNKYVLREAMAGIIPEAVRMRMDKMGFPTPAAQWFRGALGDRMESLLNESRMAERGIYRMNVIRQALAQHRRGEADHSSALFNVAQFEMWLDLVSERRSSA